MSEIQINSSDLSKKGYSNLAVLAGDDRIDIEELASTPAAIDEMKELVKKMKLDANHLQGVVVTELTTLLVEGEKRALQQGITSQASAPVADGAGGSDGKEEKNGEKVLGPHANESSPVVLNYIRAIELGLIGATPNASPTTFSSMKGGGVIKGTWNGLKAGNDRIPKVMNWANYLHTNPWIRPDLENAISIEKAANRALLANKNLIAPTREALEIREQYLTQMSDALTANDHVRFGQIAADYRRDAVGGRIARQATHIDEAIAHSILMENIPEHEKATIETKGKAEKELGESTTKVTELEAENKRLDTEIKTEQRKKTAIQADIAEQDRLMGIEDTKITNYQTQLSHIESLHTNTIQRLEDLKSGTYIPPAIAAKNTQIIAMETQITQKESELRNSSLTDTERTTLKEERTQLERRLDKLQSEKVNLIATEETRLNREIDAHQKKMEKLQGNIEASKQKKETLESKKSDLTRQKRELTTDLSEKTARKTTIGDGTTTGELKTQKDLKDSAERVIKNHESLQKAKTVLEVELAKPHPNVAEVRHLRTKYERLAGSGRIPTPPDRPGKKNERLHQVEKVSYEQAKVEVDRIEARLSAIEGEIHTKLSTIETDLKSGKITKAQAYIEVDKVIAPYNREFETIQRAGLTNLERLDPESFKKILGQSQWLKTVNKGNGLMDKFDGKVGKWAGLAVVGLMVKHTADTGFTPELKNDLIDTGVGMIPIIGGVHDLTIAWNARDLNDRKVEGWNRAGRVAFGVLGLTGVGSLVKWAGKGAQATNFAIKSATAMSLAQKTESFGEAGIRLLEPVRLAGRPVMYTALGITLYQGVMSVLPSKETV